VGPGFPVGQDDSLEKLSHYQTTPTRGNDTLGASLQVDHFFHEIQTRHTISFLLNFNGEPTESLMKTAAPLASF